MKRGWVFPVILGALIIAIFFVRLVNPVEIDDVSPGIPCEEELLEKVDVLWVIPNFEGIPISENREWCEKILSLNKTIGMHGINHNYREFGGEISKEELEEGMEIFRSCFQFTPVMFKPPHLKITEKQKVLIKEAGMELMLGRHQLTHKVYHCNDSDPIKNWIVNLY